MRTFHCLQSTHPTCWNSGTVYFVASRQMWGLRTKQNVGCRLIVTYTLQYTIIWNFWIAAFWFLGFGFFRQNITWNMPVRWKMLKHEIKTLVSRKGKKGANSTLKEHFLSTLDTYSRTKVLKLTFWKVKETQNSIVINPTLAKTWIVRSNKMKEQVLLFLIN